MGIGPSSSHTVGPMRAAARFADDLATLSPIARGAIEHLAAGKHPAPQTRATEFNTVDEIGHSDAG